MTEKQNHLVTISLLAFFVLAMAYMQLYVTFGGLKSPVAMEQAQIARNLIRGEGFVTQVHTPLEVMRMPDLKDNPKEKAQVKIAATRYAPLNILWDALLLRAVHGDDESRWLIEENAYFYPLDRVIAMGSMLCFLGALVWIYLLCVNIFDYTIANFTCFLIVVSNAFLEFAVSGLPQMMMMFFFFGGMYFLLMAVRRKDEQRKVFLPLLGCGAFLTCMCLAGWIGIWPLLGVTMFAMFYFRPHGLYVLPILGVALLGFLPVVLFYKSAGMGWFGMASYAIFNGLEGTDEYAYRALNIRDLAIDPLSLAMSFVGVLFGRVVSLYQNFGAILVAPFFVLALMHTYRKTAVNDYKWSVLCVAVMSMFGMALYSTDEVFQDGQVLLLLAPLLVAYGFSVLLVFMHKLNLEMQTRKTVRGLVLCAIVVVTMAPVVVTLPAKLRIGLMVKDRGMPNWPEVPYYPTGMVNKVRKASSPDKLIGSDQPWAVAWYADRPALWLPLKMEDFQALEAHLYAYGTRVGGLLFSPSSFDKPGAMYQLTRKNGDFAAFPLEGPLVTLTATGTTVFPANITAATAPIRERFCKPTSRLPIVGWQMVYYSEDPIPQELLE